METAKVFWSGRSQAVRLPKAFRVEGNEVRIRHQGAAIVLEPIAQDWDWLGEVQGPVDRDFEAAATEAVAEQDRPELDALFASPPSGRSDAPR